MYIDVGGSLAALRFNILTNFNFVNNPSESCWLWDFFLLNFLFSYSRCGCCQSNDFNQAWESAMLGPPKGRGCN